MYVRIKTHDSGLQAVYAKLVSDFTRSTTLKLGHRNQQLCLGLIQPCYMHMYVHANVAVSVCTYLSF